VGRGTTGAAPAPTWDAGGPADSDERLVAAVRRGDDRAFELLYQRYQRRIHAYVFGMVSDHGRAEDITQEVFVSALRRMRETEQPLAFKPWLYQIAKNSCIDAFRRSQRAQEVSYDADGALAPADHSKLIGSGPSPDAAVAAKQDLDNLCGAFGGLSETHHEILVLRELEGLSYKQIGRRMGMSRPAVESTLFRARRRLSEEYDDIVSGARCERIQGIIVTAAQSRLGTRDTRRLARHLSHCQGCRREALAAGLDRELLTRPSVRERIASRVAGLLPFPIFGRFRGRVADAASQLPLFSDHASTGWGKAAAGVAILAAGVGAGAGVREVATPSAAADRPAQVRSATASTEPIAARTADPLPRVESAAAVTTDHKGTTAKRTRDKPARAKTRTRAEASTPADPVPTAPSGAGAGDEPAKAEPTPTRDSNPPASDAAKKDSSSPREEPPAKPPSGDGGPSPTPTVPPVQETVQKTTGALDDTVNKTTQALDQTVQGTTGGVDRLVEGVTGGGTVSTTVDRVTDVVDDTVAGVGRTLDETVGGVTGALGGLGGRRGG
jgi:RNA polymerase sigma factor (sigma-70 family)